MCGCVDTHYNAQRIGSPATQAAAQSGPSSCMNITSKSCDPEDEASAAQLPQKYQVSRPSANPPHTAIITCSSVLACSPNDAGKRTSCRVGVPAVPASTYVASSLCPSRESICVRAHKQPFKLCNLLLCSCLHTHSINLGMVIKSPRGTRCAMQATALDKGKVSQQKLDLPKRCGNVGRHAMLLSVMGKEQATVPSVLDQF